MAHEWIKVETERAEVAEVLVDQLVGALMAVGSRVRSCRADRGIAGR